MCIIARGEKVLDGAIGGREGARTARATSRSVWRRAVRRQWSMRSDRQSRSSTRVDDSNRYFEIELAKGARSAGAACSESSATGASVNRFEIVQPSLHQIFLERVGATGVEEGMTGHG